MELLERKGRALDGCSLDECAIICGHLRASVRGVAGQGARAGRAVVEPVSAFKRLVICHSPRVTLSIVVPAFNEEKLIAATLDRIHAAREAFTRLGWESEIIVCDNNSNDRTPELARAAGAKVVFEPVNQIARARNSGARAATGDWLIFVDADSHPSVELFGEVANVIRAGRAIAGGCLIQFDGQNREANFWIGIWNIVSRLTRYAAGSFIFCEAAGFREIGGFNEKLFATEELDLSRRLKKLARQRNRKMVIITRHRLITSVRKIMLYSRFEHIRFITRTIVSGGRVLRNRDDCPVWYDGRR